MLETKNLVDSGPVNEFRCIGPPGCGKTSWLSRQVEVAVEKHGSDSVLVMSLTRAAAAEVAGRNLPVAPEQVGTLHSHAFRSLSSPRIANDHKSLSEWNEYVEEHGNPQWQIREGLDRDDFGGAEESWSGDELFALMDTYRARMLPRDRWPRADVVAFADEWSSWKERTYRKDFTDLIELCIQNVSVAPGEPRVLFLDEAQDFSRLELELARKWAQHAEMLVIAGDPDQAIYGWRGADASNFVSPEIPESHYRKLEQSFRVPKKPHRVALDWIRQIKERRDVPYRPREEEGSVESIQQVFHHPDFIFRDAEPHLAAGKTVMFLATASYLLKPLIGFMREQGIPFHNPYVEKRGDWNPLRSRRGSTNIASRLKSFLYGGWLEDPSELRAWLEMLKLDHFRADKNVSKQFLAELKGPISIEQLQGVFHEDALKKALGTDLEWLREGLLKEFAAGSRASAFDYVCRIAKRYGDTALGEKPQVIVGTIHSVKGGEADVVYVFPDLSKAAGDEYFRTPEGQAAAIRVMYVAFTRAKERLVLCAPASSRCVDFPAVA